MSRTLFEAVSYTHLINFNSFPYSICVSRWLFCHWKNSFCPVKFYKDIFSFIYSSYDSIYNIFFFNFKFVVYVLSFSFSYFLNNYLFSVLNSISSEFFTVYFNFYLVSDFCSFWDFSCIFNRNFKCSIICLLYTSRCV